MAINIEKNRIQGDAFAIPMEYPVVDAVESNGQVLVLYDYMACDQHNPSSNLYCYTKDGDLLWRAVDIRMGNVGAYTDIIEKDPLWVRSAAGYKCRIDDQNGEVLAKVRAE
jgi:hypothetical protein